MVNLKGKHPKIKRKLKNPEERKRESFYNFTKPHKITTKQNLVLKIITSVYMYI